jgi:hypothetical protein
MLRRINDETDPNVTLSLLPCICICIYITAVAPEFNFFRIRQAGRQAGRRLSTGTALSKPPAHPLSFERISRGHVTSGR